MTNTDSQARASEIQDLVASDQLNKATNRLMDFQREFGNDKHYLHEVINIKREYHALNEMIRSLGNTKERDHDMRELVFRILQTVESIKENYQSIEQNTTYPENTTLSQQENLSIPTNLVTVNNQAEIGKSKTKYELDKEIFFNKKFINTDSIYVFEGKDISRRYKNNSVPYDSLLKINISLKLGEITAVVGENGSGKTTLLRIIAGELASSTGELSYPCLTLNSKTELYAIKQQIAYLPQELPKWYGLLVNNLHFTASIHGITGQDNQNEVDFVMSRLGLEQYKYAKWNEISGGYKMRFALAKAIIFKPKLIILDEPLANLDINTQVSFLEDLRDFANSIKDRTSIIISSQHLYEVENIADQIIFIKEGRAEYNGSVKNFGEDRKNNSYEISCNLSKQEIMDILDKIDYNLVEKTANNFIIHTSRQVNSTELLKVFIEHNVSLKYFRDISKSTRKLF